METNALEKEVWRNFLTSAESDLIRRLPTIPGGRLENESVLEYRDRALSLISVASERYIEAKKHLDSLA